MPLSLPNKNMISKIEVGTAPQGWLSVERTQAHPFAWDDMIFFRPKVKMPLYNHPFRCGSDFF
jgi:hypothetical protein